MLFCLGFVFVCFRVLYVMVLFLGVVSCCFFFVWVCSVCVCVLFCFRVLLRLSTVQHVIPLVSLFLICCCFVGCFVLPLFAFWTMLFSLCCILFAFVCNHGFNALCVLFCAWVCLVFVYVLFCRCFACVALVVMLLAWGCFVLPLFAFWVMIFPFVCMLCCFRVCVLCVLCCIRLSMF